ncbi:putative iron permease membrane protein [Candidozyma auris]|uniref:Iron transporter FTH1 n=2 Tax=Candidozyma auris TaxID=498019 RepID=A0AB36W7L8_CANAR|nr:hypothetical protein B9J08_002464 [[Candida] auris]PIS55310.1 hypothetical protein CJI97_002008 [[Candida] auris]QWW25789.1 hypothetical protein CA7LBN_004693 [[Candida] auris]
MTDLNEIFSIQIFFIILRETLETAIIISVLLSFINKNNPTSDEVAPQDETEEARLEREAKNLHVKSVNRSLRLQVWLGAICGLLVCLIIGIVFIVLFYLVEKDLWSYTERLWEGVFSLLSSVIITVMGIGLLRINKIMKVKWWVKLGDAYATQSPGKLDADMTEMDDFNGMSTSQDSDALLGNNTTAKKQKKEGFSTKYFLAILPFVTTLREGLEAVVFVGGIGMSQPLTSLPLAVLAGMACGAAVGYSLYKGGNKLSLQYFLICSTCFLYIVSAGLMSRGVWFLELERYVRLCGGLDVSETGSGPGSYDISTAIWHVNCCNGLTDGWWMVANALVGWTNTATYGSISSYLLYWICVSAWLRAKLYEEKHGRLPVIPLRWQMKKIRKKLRIYEAMHRQQSTEEGEREAEALAYVA